MAQLGLAVGGAIIGAGIGFLIGGPSGALLGAQLGFTGGAILGAILFPVENESKIPADQNIRLSSVATSRPIPIIWGVVRLAGQTLWTTKPVFVEHTEEVGGKGAPSSKVTTTETFLSWISGICMGPIEAVTRIWFDSELVFDISDAGSGITPAMSALLLASLDNLEGTGVSTAVSFDENVQTINVQGFGPFRIYLGGENQPIDPMLQNDTRIGEVFGGVTNDFLPAFHGLAMCAFEFISGDATNGHYPNVEFEVLKSSNPSFAGAEEKEPVPSRSRLYRLPDLITHISPEGNARVQDPFYKWNTVDRNVDNPEELPAKQNVTALGGDSLAQIHNVGTFDDPQLRFLFEGGAGNSAWSWFRLDTGQELLPRSIISPSSLQNLSGWYWPSTANPTRYIGAAPSAGSIFSFPLYWSSSVPGQDLASLLVLRDNVPLPELGIGTLHWNAGPGFVGPDGLLYTMSGETASEHRIVVAIDPVTLEIKRFAEPYTASPSSDDLCWSSCRLTYDSITDKIILHGDGILRRMDRETLTLDDLPDLTSTGGAFQFTENALAFEHGPVFGVMWLQVGGGEHTDVNVQSWTADNCGPILGVSDYGLSEAENQNPLFDPVNNAISLDAFFNTDWMAFLPVCRAGPVCVPASEIADDISDFCDVPASLRNTTLWDPYSICGYVVGRRVSGLHALEPIMGLINGDYRTQDGIVQFYINDTAAIDSIPEIDLAYVEIREEPLPPENIGWPYERELPYRIDMKFVDRELDFDMNTVGFDRPQEDFKGRGKKVVTMPVVFWGDNSIPTAQDAVERMLYQFDINRDQHILQLSWEYLKFNIGDSFDYTVEDRTYTVRIERLAISDLNQIIIGAKSEDIVVNVGSGQTGIEAPILFVPPSLSAPMSSQFWLIDGPLLRDQDDNANTIPVYLAAAPSSAFNDTWSGALLEVSSDGGATYNGLTTYPGGNAVDWGRTTTALADTARPFAIDRTNSVTIQMNRGILPGALSLQDLVAVKSRNALLIGNEVDGWEVVRYADIVATAGSPDILGDTFTISTLLRGQKGTNNFTGSHRIGDYVIVLDASKIKMLSLPLGDLNVEKRYRMVSVGQGDSQGTVKDFTLAGGTKKPRSLTRVRGSRNPSTGTWTITATRRTRVGGGWVDFVEPPIGETITEYECDVKLTSGGTVVASKTGLTSPSATFTGDDLGISPSSDTPFSLFVDFYQMSEQVGRGYTEEVEVRAPVPGH